MKRPATRWRILAAAMHHGDELGAGAGLPGQSILRLRGAMVGWVTAFVAWWLLAPRDSNRAPERHLLPYTLVL